MNEIIWEPIKKMSTDGDPIGDPHIDELKKMYSVLQGEYAQVRKKNIKLIRKMNATFKRHPLKRRGCGWVWHSCGIDCYRRIYPYGNDSEMVHSIKMGSDGEWL